MKIICVVLCVFLGGCAVYDSHKQTNVALFKRVSLDDFYVKKVVSNPLSIEIPKEYEYAAQIKVPLTYAYWMRAEDQVAVVANGRLPVENGWVYGKVSLDVAYDSARDSFGEDKIERDLKSNGMDVLDVSRRRVNGYPALNVKFRAKNKLVCYMYVGMLVSTNVLFIAYRPPNNDEGLCDYFLSSLS